MSGNCMPNLFGNKIKKHKIALLENFGGLNLDELGLLQQNRPKKVNHTAQNDHKLSGHK
jgi:hypothetical protein